MEASLKLEPRPRAQTQDVRQVLNTGSGPSTPNSLHRAFASAAWQEVRLDINPAVKPDLVGTIRDMHELIADATYDAIWSSHNIEHLHPHEVVPALREFSRVLKPDGFALVTCPDLYEVARLVLEKGLDATIYTSSAGPITPLDMLYGHVRSVAAGNKFMCHNCGFTEDTLGTVAMQAGFAEARVSKGDGFTLWAVLLMPQASPSTVATWLRETTESFLMTE